MQFKFFFWLRQVSNLSFYFKTCRQIVASLSFKKNSLDSPGVRTQYSVRTYLHRRYIITYGVVPVALLYLYCTCTVVRRIHLMDDACGMWHVADLKSGIAYSFECCMSFGWECECMRRVVSFKLFAW